jgi:hypothetical protein
MTEGGNRVLRAPRLLDERIGVKALIEWQRSS